MHKARWASPNDKWQRWDRCCEARAQPRTVLLCCAIELDSHPVTFASVAFYEVTRLAVSSNSYKFILWRFELFLSGIILYLKHSINNNKILLHSPTFDPNRNVIKDKNVYLKDESYIFKDYLKKLNTAGISIHGKNKGAKKKVRS